MHLIPELLQEPGADFRDVRIVFDQKHGAARRSLRGGLGGRLLGTCLRARQIKCDPGALPELALDLHRPAGLMHKTMYLGESEPGAFAPLLGREKRIEYFRQDVRGDAAAGVRDRERDEIALEILLGLASAQPRVLRRD